MDSWYSVNLGNAINAEPTIDKIQKMFTPLFAKSGSPIDMAVFYLQDSTSNDITIYFTPKTHVLAKAFNATSCQKPQYHKKLGLLVGSQSAVKHFFLVS